MSNAYLNTSGYKNDVFVSYAHVDNEPVLDSEIKWVSNFIDDLGKFLARRLRGENGANPYIWIDHELAFNKPLNESLTNELRQTATFLIIMSLAYLESEWCKKERQQFFEILKEKGSNTRVFIVEIDEIDRKMYPIEINEYVIPYKFWKKENSSKAKMLGFPKRADDEDYSNRLVDISVDLANELASIKKLTSMKMKSNEPQVRPTIPKGNIFLAQVTDDLDERREEIKRYFKDEGYKILPEENMYSSYETGKLKETMEENFANCLLYVQLLSHLPGKKLPSSNNTITSFQFELAKSSGKKMMIWRSSDIDINKISDLSLRQIHESEYVQSGVFEEFKSAVLKSVNKPIIDPSPPVPRFIYVCTDVIDRHYCEEKIIPKIEEKKLDYALPLRGDNKNISAIRKFQEQNLLSCDAAVFVYCDSDPDIVFNQIMHCRKINTDRKDPFKIVAIYDGPPTEKDKIELALQNMNFSYLNCRETPNDFDEKFLNIL
jgi:hypothetical protein